VRWYLHYKLSLRDLVEMMSERGLRLAHTTILRWVQRYAPEFVKRWNRFGRPAGRAWRVVLRHNSIWHEKARFVNSNGWEETF
jgi:transposase-like protein